MRAPLLVGLLILFQADLDYDLGLPPQPDLDLPVVLGHYDPSNPAPGPVPPKEDADDPRDEPPPVFFGEEIPTPTDSIFYVIDFSASMHNEGRVLKAKAEFARSVTALPPSMRFNVIVYSCLLLRWSETMQAASPANKAAAIEFVNERFPMDGTGTGPATALALGSDRANLSIALLTDGEPNCGANGIEGHRTMIRNANSQGAVINVFGIAASGPWREFCADVARDSAGSYFDVP